MVQAILELFTTTEKAETMLAHPIIELIFTALFVLFLLAVAVHFILFFKLKGTRAYLKTAKKVDLEPLRSFQEEFEQKQRDESVRVETFVQEKFSSWRILNIPIVQIIKLVQMTISIFILLGVLGTFIGLTISLGNLQLAEDQLVENVAGVLSGIDVAFYTSIVGMSFSLLMTLFTRAFNTEYMLTDIMLTFEGHLGGREQNGMNRLIQVSEAINESILHLQESNQQSLQNMERAFTGFQEYTEGLQQSAKDLAAFNEGLSANLRDFKRLFQQMKSVTDGFGEGTNRLNKNFDSLFAYFKRADQRNERMATAFEQSYARIQDVSEVQIKTLVQFEESIDDIKSFTSSLLNDQNRIQGSLEKMTLQSQSMVEKMGAHNETFKNIFGSNLSGKLGVMTNQLAKLSKDFDTLGNSVSQLPQALETIQETQQEYKNLLSNRFRELEEFNQSFGRHLQDHASQSQVFEKHMLDASRTYEQVGMKNSQLLSEIDGVLSKMNQTFTNREQQLETNVDLLKETLSKYVHNLEATLGDKLEKVARIITELVDSTTHEMKREFVEIRRGSEGIQQSSFRSIQQLLEELRREFQLLNRTISTLSSYNRPVEQIGVGRGLRHDDY